jgi:glycosyltransferase involved in cell wall biosynthesis
MSLDKHGFEVIFIAPYGHPRTLEGNITIVGVPILSSRPRRMLNTWRILIKALQEKADIYHFHDPELIPCAIFLRLISRKPVIYDVHEHNPDALRLKEYINSRIRNFFAKLFDWFELNTAPFFNAIITADDAVAGRFQGSNNRIVILYNFPKKGFGETDGALTNSRAYPVQLIYVGSMCPERGQWLMLDVVRILVDQNNLDVGLWIIGSFDSEEKRREFIETVETDELLQGRVISPGFIPQSQLGAWLSSADIGLVPLQPVDKFYKNIPTKMFEYMAASLPIVGSDLPPISRFLLAANAGFVADPDDPQSHAEKILSLVENPEMAKEMGQNGRHAFQTRYNWTSEENKLVSLYRELLNLDQPTDNS